MVRSELQHSNEVLIMGIGLAIAGLVIGTLASAGGAVISAKASNNQALAQSYQVDAQMQNEKTQMAIESAERQRELQRVLATQTAIFGGSNVSLSSGTPLTLAQDSVNEAKRQQGYAGALSSSRMAVYSAQKSQYRSGMVSPLLSGTLAGVGTLAGGLSSIGGAMSSSSAVNAGS
jgi:hypothetical protein